MRIWNFEKQKYYIRACVDVYGVYANERTTKLKEKIWIEYDTSAELWGQVVENIDYEKYVGILTVRYGDRHTNYEDSDYIKSVLEA